MCVTSLIFAACRTVSDQNLEETSAKLHGVYDDSQLLRLSKFPGKTGLYHFETCLFNNDSTNQTNTCIPALRDNSGDSVVFALLTLQNIPLRDDNQTMMAGMHNSWRDYQNILAMKLEGRRTAVKLGSTSGGVAAILSLVEEINLKKTISKSQKEISVFKTNVLGSSK